MYWGIKRITTSKLLAYLFAVAALVSVSLSLSPPSAHAVAGINEQLNYQARLLNSNGAVVPDGTYNMEFKIYRDGTGCVSGGSSPCGGTLLWTETRTTTNRVTVTNGYFSVQLGEVTPFSTSIDWNQSALWLSVNIGGTAVSPSWDGEMTPFRRLAAAPYALNAKQLGGLDWSKFVQIAPSAAQVDSSTLSTLFLNKTGASGNILQLQKSGSDVAVVNNSGSVLSSAFDSITTGSLNFGTSSANAITIGNSTNNSTVTINSGTGAINIGTGAQARTINIGTGSAAQTLNLGSTNTSTAATLTAGGTKLIANNTGINVLGSTANGSSGRVYFGDVPNVSIGETGTTDTDSMTLHGANGFNFTSGFGTATLRLSIDQFGDIRVGQSDTNGALFVLDTKTNSGDPTGTNGAMYYNSNSSKFRCYEGSAWKDCIPSNPQSVFNQNGTSIDNFTSSSYAAPTSSVEITFVAPSSGRAKIDMLARLDADNPAEQAAWDVQVRQTNSSGTVISSPNAVTGGGAIYFDPDYPASTNYNNWRYLSGLTPGQTYWAQLQFNTAGTTMDITQQSLLYIPLP